MGTLPNPSTAYLRALLPRGRSGLQTPPPIEVAGVTFSAGHLRAYCASIGSSRPCPALYPQVLSAGLPAELILHPAFPFRSKTVVHVANVAEVHAPLDPGLKYTFRASVGDSVLSKRGPLVDLLTEVRGPEGAAAACYTTRILVPGTNHRGDASAQERWEAPLAPAQAVHVSRRSILRYARISRDWNPIHISWLGARLLGFKRPIAHGLWLAARALREFESELAVPFRYEVQFQRPMFLPAAADLVVDRSTMSSAWLDAGKTLMVARLTSGSEQHPT